MIVNWNEILLKPFAQALVQQVDETFPSIDLKGHTIEELAKFANVSVDTIKSAIQMRQQQMMIEKKNNLNSLKTKPAISTNFVTPLTTATHKTITTHATKSIPYVPKKKITKYIFNKGHKVI